MGSAELTSRPNAALVLEVLARSKEELTPGALPTPRTQELARLSHPPPPITAAATVITTRRARMISVPRFPPLPCPKGAEGLV